MTEARFTLLLDGGAQPDRELVGGKAWSLARMRRLGLNVPPAFVLTTKTCAGFHAAGRQLPEGAMAEVLAGIRWIESCTGRGFGGDAAPLLVSVRSGAPVSMPGMMDTVLNLGITPATERALAAESGSERFARDTHRRFCELYARIVLRAEVPALDPGATPADWHAAIAACGCGAIPTEPQAQLEAAIGAVFESWNSRRARKYRQHHGIADDIGTAVTVQAMVFGNTDQRSGTGVLFSRNPLTGTRGVYGEYLARAQGEDVVSGSHTPLSLDALAATLPEVHRELLLAAGVLERDNGDMQDIEFTVERGKLFLLQSRAAKRSPAAAVQVAVDLVREGRIDVGEALRRISAEQVRMLLRPRLAPDADLQSAVVLARGEAASPGVGAGIVVGDADAAEALHAQGHDVILARPTTSPEDLHGMLVARAIVTERGGATSHAAVVGRQLGVPCVVGCGDGTVMPHVGETVTVDGSGGRVFAGRMPVELPREDTDPALREVRRWALLRSPVRVFRTGELVPGGVVDLDLLAGGAEADAVGALLSGARGAAGSVLNTDDGVRAAVDAGVEFIVVRDVLPALLAAAAARPTQLA